MRNAGAAAMGEHDTGDATQMPAVGDDVPKHTPRKRKSKGGDQVLQTPDLNALPEVSNAIVTVGFVNSRVNQIDGGSESSGESMVEKLKKQKRGTFSQTARSAAAAFDSPARHNENPLFELLGFGPTRGSSRPA
jgi:hypothetical protein